MTDAERMRISVSLDRVTREDRFRVTAFYAGLACVVIFSLAALTFAAWAVIGTSKIESGGWFLMLLPPAFILPATIIFISIIRAVYPAGKNNTESTSASDNIPHVKLFNELFNAAKDSSS